MRQHSYATRSIRRRPRVASRVGSRVTASEQAALQVFVFRGETFLGTELFDSGRPVMIGRHHDTTLRLDGETVSRYHARISVVGRQLFVEDLDSGNGTLVNRERIDARSELKTGDQIHVGPYTLRLKLLVAPGPRPYDPSKSEDTTKINAILAAERAGGAGTDEVEVGLDDSTPSLNEALYREAIRRTTGGGEKAQAPAASLPQSALEDDSTQMAAEDLLARGRSAVPVVLEPSAEDREMEARLKDLDALIATLEAEDRRGSGPWANENTAPTTTELDVEDALFPPSTSSEPVDTRQFARDLASRLALNGEVVQEQTETPKPEAKVIPLRTKTRVPTPIPQVPLDEDEDPTEADELDPALAAAAELDDDNPETDLLVGGIPPQLAPQILAGAQGSAMTPSPVQERAQALRDPAASGPAPVPAKGLVFPGRSATQAPAPTPKSIVDDAPTRPAPRTPSPAAAAPEPAAKPPKRAAAHVEVVPAAPRRTPPPLPPKKRRRAHEARLMTPTSLRVDVSPMQKLDDSGLLADVFTQGDTTPKPQLERPVPPPLPKRRSATEARPRSRIDDFSEAVKRLPDEPIPTHWDGVEVSARVNGQLVDISVLRKAGEEYILGHRTPQGAIAPARAHLGLRLVRVNKDDTVDLVFPRQVGGHLMRGKSTVTFSDLAEGRKYSSLRLEDRDVATIVLGQAQDTITYHVRFLRRPKSLFRSLRGLRR